MLSKKSNLNEQVNNVSCNFHNSSCLTKIKRDKAYCTNSHGAEIWDWSHSGIECIYTAWRKGRRRIWQIPTTIYLAHLPGLLL
jgi:hypothetical protein